jgi:hypothetical protein
MTGIMEIQALRVMVREDEINEYLPQAVPPDAGVENLRVRLAPEGVVIQGSYPTVFMKIAFETLWTVSVADGRLHARLTNVKVAGLPAGLLRGVLLKVIRDATAKQPGFSVAEDALVLDVGQLLQERKVPVHVNLTAVHCGPGHVVIEAGTPPANV